MMNRSFWRCRTGRLAALIAPLVGVAGCDFKVTNPGPVEDSFLGQAAAHAGVVNGAGRDLAEALNWLAYVTASPTREIHPAGSTGSFGITPQQQRGELLDHQLNTEWSYSHRARWTAEDGARRMKEAMGDADFARSTQAAQITLWAGYANRLLGENMCEAVINGSAPQPHTVHFERAEAHFTEAMQIAQAANQANLVNAARAGRASARMYLGKWSEAVADAQAVPVGFRYNMPYFLTELDQYNRVHEASRSQPYRAHTVWNTVYENYFTETQDPRVRWVRLILATGQEQTGDAAVALRDGTSRRVPWYNQQKHPERTSPIALSTGREMRLIEAEAMLQAGDWQGALTMINSVRTSTANQAAARPLQPWTAGSAAEVWTILKRERGIELWLEARRMGDMRRWNAANRPGSYHVLEVVGVPSNLSTQDLCIPISRSERETNPNIPT
jgi:starch-binding outer membrane protein, SusD/RagB family